MVLFIVALLAGVAMPNVESAVLRAREAALAQNLAVMRDAIDAYRADKGMFPERLERLVEERYLRFLPRDPVHDSFEWGAVTAPEIEGVVDVRSLSTKIGSNEKPYDEW